MLRHKTSGVEFFEAQILGAVLAVDPLTDVRVVNDDIAFVDDDKDSVSTELVFFKDFPQASEREGGGEVAVGLGSVFDEDRDAEVLPL